MNCPYVNKAQLHIELVSAVMSIEKEGVSNLTLTPFLCVKFLDENLASATFKLLAPY